ncbi:MAG: FkbM family methyltransferase [Opitutales bacterium]|nr:FkbM family methyltransferase [Opitutales bacterium]
MSFIYGEYLGDIRLHIDTRYLVERIAWTGAYEPELQHYIRRSLPPGAVALDIGANIGAVTLGLAQQVGQQGRIHAFEPAPPNRKRLAANLDLNPDLARRVDVHPVALGEKSANLYWNEEPGNPGNGWLRDSGKIPVPVRTLDEVAPQLNLSRLDFIKIDVEGMEEAVLRGGRDTVCRWKPVLYFETLARFRNEGTGHGSILDDLRPLGYRFHRLRTDGTPVPLAPGKWDSYTLAVA